MYLFTIKWCVCVHSAAVFHVEVGPDAAVQHHSAKALHLESAKQHGGHQPWAGEGLHQRQWREGGAKGGALLPRNSCFSKPVCYSKLWEIVFPTVRLWLHPAVPGGSWWTAGTLPSPAAQQQHSQCWHPDSLSPRPVQQLFQSVPLPLTSLPTWIARRQSLLHRGSVVRPG